MTIAEFDSRCPVCDEMIHEGDAVDVDDDGEWCHAECAEDES